jgi:hypothetical protein
MATYRGILIAPITGIVTIYVYQFDGTETLLTAGIVGDEPTHLVWEAEMNGITGLSAADVYSDTDGVDTTVSITVDYDDSAGNKPIAFKIAIPFISDDTFVMASFCTINVLSGDTTTCDECYTLTMEECDNEIHFTIPLESFTEYIIKITDELGNSYKQTATSDVDGHISFDLTNILLPEGLFTAHGGLYEVTFRLPLTPNVNESFIVDTVEYTCININFENITATT